jgi:hypothetical protein
MPNWIFIVLTHCGEAANTNFIVFGLTQLTGSNQRSTTLETITLNTTPSMQFDVNAVYNLH